MVARTAGRLYPDRAEEGRGLADPVSLVEPGSQPFDPRHIALGIAALATRCSRRLQDRVALLPLAQRVGSDAGALCECRDIQPAAHTSPRKMPVYADDMPEGDSLHRAAARMQVLAGQKVEVEAPHPRASGKGLVEQLDGKTLESVEAVGKNLLLRFEGGLTLRSHLRMTGRWRVEQRGARRTGRPWLVFRGDTSEAVLWNGPVLELVRGSRRLSHLGPDILDRPPDLEEMLERFRAVPQSRQVGDAVLDQRLVAGIGNMWKAEALWDVRVSPWRPLADVSDIELLAALDSAAKMMRAGVDGARPLRHIYRRAGRACHRCGGVIRSYPQGVDARTAYWCPKCQVGGREPKA